VLPFEQGGLDSLCGIYSLVNAERMINRTSADDSVELFNSIISFLDGKRLLASILTNGMLLRYIKAVLAEVIGDRIANKELRFAGVANPDLDVFWNEIFSFHSESPRRAVLLSMSGVHDHWTVVKDISERQMQLFDSNGLLRLNRINCTTAYQRGQRHHILWPAQTIFLSGP
jgi:hypothetical protein